MQCLLEGILCPVLVRQSFCRPFALRDVTEAAHLLTSGAIHQPLKSIQHCVRVVKTFPSVRRYGQPKMWTRDNASGYWTSCLVCAPEPTLPEPTLEASGAAQPQALTSDSQTEEDSAAAEAAASVTEEADADVALDQLLRQSLVLVEVEIPHVALMDGVHAKSFEGQSSGLEMDATLRFFLASSLAMLKCVDTLGELICVACT